MKAVPWVFAGLILLGGAGEAYTNYETHHVAVAEARHQPHASVIPQGAGYPIPQGLGLSKATGRNRTRLHLHGLHVLHIFRPYVIRRIFHPYRAFRYSFWGF